MRRLKVTGESWCTLGGPGGLLPGHKMNKGDTMIMGWQTPPGFCATFLKSCRAKEPGKKSYGRACGQDWFATNKIGGCVASYFCPRVGGEEFAVIFPQTNGNK